MMKRRRSGAPHTAPAADGESGGSSGGGLEERSPNVEVMRSKRRCLGAEGLGASIPRAGRGGGCGAAGVGLSNGTPVMVVGVTSSLTSPWKSTALNGRRGTVEAYDAQSGLHTVRLDGTGAQRVQLHRAQCQPIPQFAPQQSASSVPTPWHPQSAAASTHPEMQASASGINPSLLIEVLSVLGAEDRSRVLRLCSNFADSTAAATSAATAAAAANHMAGVSAAEASSPAAAQHPPCAPAGTPNLSDMPQASPISPAPSAAQEAFPTPGLVFMGTDSSSYDTSRSLQQEKRAGELKQRGDKAASKSQQSRRDENAKRQKQQRMNKLHARRAAAVSAASSGTIECTRAATVEASQTPATTHEEEEAAAAPAAQSRVQSAVPTPAVIDPTQATVPTTTRPSAAADTSYADSAQWAHGASAAQSPVVPTPVVPTSSGSAGRQQNETTGADAPACASPVDMMKRVLQRVRSNPGPSAEVSTDPDAAAVPSAAGSRSPALGRPSQSTASPSASRAEPTADAGAVNTSGGSMSSTSQQHTAPTPISAQDTNNIAPTPAAPATPSAKKGRSGSRAANDSKASTVPVTAPPTPNTAAARHAEDLARAAAVLESKKAANALRKEMELEKKQSQAVQRLRQANADADSEKVSACSAMRIRGRGESGAVWFLRAWLVTCPWPHQVQKHQLSGKIEKELAARHRGRRFPEVLRFYVDHNNIRTGSSIQSAESVYCDSFAAII